MSELDNPIWSSLCSRQQAFAQRMGEVARYPADVAPFAGVAHADVDAARAFADLVPPGDSVYLLGVAPRLPEEWRVKSVGPLAQMVCGMSLPVIDGPEVIELAPRHRDDVLALTALVYPHYFRPRTMEMGRYFGMYVDGQLAAIIGERMAPGAFQEISAVCTHPDFLGRGYARRLLALLTNDILTLGRTPFLHVSHENRRAKGLYEQMGYRTRTDIDFWAVQRAG